MVNFPAGKRGKARENPSDGRILEKAVILAAGNASRMQSGVEEYLKDAGELDAVRRGEKMAVRFDTFPFLDYQILNLVKSGVKKINLVLNPDDNFFRNHYSTTGRKVFPEVDISFSIQTVSDGTAHAVLAAEDFTEEDCFLVLNGDNHYSVRAISMLAFTPSESCGVVAYDRDGFSAYTQSRLSSFAVLESHEGRLTRIVEKAQHPENHAVSDFLFTMGGLEVEVRGSVLASMNLWFFTPDIIEMCRNVPRHVPRKPGKPGEFELPDAVGLLLQQGREVLVYYACEDVLDLTKPEDISVVGRSIRENLDEEIAELAYRYTGRHDSSQ
jgi:dTDP-glucose pyrophosphorylase